MNLADLNIVDLPPSHSPIPSSVVPTLGDVMGRLSEDVAVPLTHALDRLTEFVSSGRIDKAGLKALRGEIGAARRAGLRGQQIARFAGGQVQQSVERVALSAVLTEVLDELAPHAPAGAFGRRLTLSAVEILGDLSLVHLVLRSAADWSLGCARSAIDWRLDVKPWPVQGRLVCRFDHRPEDLETSEPGHAEMPGADELDTLDWLLLQYAAQIAGVTVMRELDAKSCTLTLAFPHTVNDTLEGASAVDLGGTSEAIALPAGSQVLVLATRRDVRQLVREALQGQDLFIDYVPSVVAAHEYCDEGCPQVLIYESSFEGESMRALQARMSQQLPAPALIEITPAGRGCEVGQLATRIGPDGLRQSLSSVLVMELARRS